jgi:hypothetical protein
MYKNVYVPEKECLDIQDKNTHLVPAQLDHVKTDCNEKDFDVWLRMMFMALWHLDQYCGLVREFCAFLTPPPPPAPTWTPPPPKQAELSRILKSEISSPKRIIRMYNM